MTRAAAIDMGTNSTRLLVADVEDGQLIEVDRRLAITGLGRGVDATGRLADDAIARVRACLDGYRAAIDAHGAERTLAVATSAVRDAANGREFLDAVAADYRVTARLLDGREEADMTFRGVTSDREIEATTLVVDIGGGSTELIVGSNGTVDFATSLQMGCVRMTERYLHDDPPTPEQLEECGAAVRDLLPEIEPAAAIGVAGTVTTAAALDLGLKIYDATLIHRHRVSLAAVDAIHRRLASLPLVHRERVEGLEKERAPVIVAGLTVLREVMRRYAMHTIEASERDILHGAALAAAASA